MTDKRRRKTLKGFALTIPAVWSPPIIKTVVLPAHAQTSEVTRSPPCQVVTFGSDLSNIGDENSLQVTLVVDMPFECLGVDCEPSVELTSEETGITARLRGPNDLDSSNIDLFFTTSNQEEAPEGFCRLNISIFEQVTSVALDDIVTMTVRSEDGCKCSQDVVVQED